MMLLMAMGVAVLLFVPLAFLLALTVDGIVWLDKWCREYPPRQDEFCRGTFVIAYLISVPIAYAILSYFNG